MSDDLHSARKTFGGNSPNKSGPVPWATAMNHSGTGVTGSPGGTVLATSPEAS